MSELLEFLEFCWNHQQDKRFHLSKKVKYGWVSYYISWDLLNTSMTIHIDSRNQIIELSSGYESTLTIENPFLFLEMYNKCELEYNRKIEGSIDQMINNFFNSLEKEDKDLSRIWKLGKMDFLNDGEDKDGI